MSERVQIFRDGLKELVLPVTPEEFRMVEGTNVEIINIHEVGDVAVPGYRTLASIKIPCMFPARNYPFVRDSDPEPYIQQFQRWREERKRIRWIVSDTGINLPVLVEEFAWGEEDGTNDVYADILLRQYPQLEAVQIIDNTENKARAGPETQEKPIVQDYRVVYGDTMSALCRRFYGNGNADHYTRLANYNGRSNPNIIWAGEILKIPKPLP